MITYTEKNVLALCFQNKALPIFTQEAHSIFPSIPLKEETHGLFITLQLLALYSSLASWVSAVLPTSSSG